MTSTRDDVLRALSLARGVKSAVLEEREGVVVARVGWIRSWEWTVEDARSAIRDVMREHLAAGVSWIAVVEAVVVRPAAYEIRPSIPNLPVGSRLVVASAAWSDVRRGLPLRWLVGQCLRRALWWRRRDLHVVTRVTPRVVECERLRWRWRTWSWEIDRRLTDAERRALAPR